MLGERAVNEERSACFSLKANDKSNDSRVGNTQLTAECIVTCSFSVKRNYINSVATYGGCYFFTHRNKASHQFKSVTVALK